MRKGAHVRTTETLEYKEVDAIVSRHLAVRQRQAKEYAFDPSSRLGTPVYVMRMLEEVQRALRQRGIEVNRDDLERADSQASGHVDYHNKVVLYLAELAIRAGREQTASA